MCAMMAALMAVCSWISIPIGEIPVTLQTFGVFAALGILGGRLGTISVLVYIFMGAVGLPVLAGFSGGLGAFMSASGGYISGFAAAALTVWAFERFTKDNIFLKGISMILGMAVCYLFGTVWYVAAFLKAGGGVSFGAALSLCVLPFIIPDLVKIACALIITERVKKYAAGRS